MPQKQVTEAGTFGCAFDQTGQVSHHKALLWANPHHTQIGVERGERVVRDARAGVRDGGDEGRFAGIGHAQQTNVGEHFQFEFQAFLFTGPSRCFGARCTVGRALKAQVAKAAIAAFGNQYFFTRHQQFEQNIARLGIGEDGADWHFQDDVVPLGAKHVRAFAVLAVAGVMPP